jgi:NAD(P)-dependent dehydrogenase (short-subunit alcohol dehydrogenase family)
VIDGLVALVTGGGSGLGAAISRRLAADGATLVVNDLRADAAEATAKEVDGEAMPFDVTDSAAFDAAVDDVVARHGRIDIVVNNAGLLHDRPEVTERSMAALMTRMGGGTPEPVRALSTLSDELWDRMIKVHLYGTFHGTRAALRHMETVRSGSIVNVASIYGLRGAPTTPDYAAAKHGIVGLTRSAAVEYAQRGLRINAVAPGPIDAPSAHALPPEVRASIAAKTAMNRIGQTSDVAAVVSFLLSDQAAFVTGSVYEVNGGQTQL